MSDYRNYNDVSKTSDLQLRINLYKESNNNLNQKLLDTESKLKHKVRENAIMKNGYDLIMDSENTPEHIKKFCKDILINVEKFYKK